MSDLLRVENLGVEFRAAGRRGRFRAVEDVSFTVAPGETVALVGESGSGKSTIGRAVLGLTPAATGSIHFDGEDITHRTRATRRSLARRLQVVFQDPYSSLNPTKTIGESLTEPPRGQARLDRRSSQARVSTLLTSVGLPEDAVDRYPNHFSGGQRQRIAIARALVLEPSLVVCDEPTSALDVSTQAQVLELLKELQARLGLAYLFITHDLAVVRHFADRVLVLRRGALVEQGGALEVCERPRDPYTKQLIAAAPVPDPRIQARRREARLAAAGVTAGA
jgi:ABC-type glutathione transport system ATPase component